MANATISVIMTVYNAEKYLKESIESVLSQTYTDLQFIIVDDGSTDHTADIVRGFSDPRIELHQLPENRHIAYATNYAFRKIKGAYTAIIDGDDIWYPDKLEKQLAFLKAHPELNGCFTWVDLIDENGDLCNDRLADLKKYFESSTDSREEWLRFFFFYGNRLNNPSSLIESSTIPVVGDHSLFYIQAMDMEWWVRFTKKFTFGIVEEPLVKYRRILSSDANVSSPSEEHDARFYNEYMHIRYHMFDDMDDDLFIRAFGDYFRCPDSASPDELACEKALLAGDCRKDFLGTPLALLKIEALLDRPETARLLKDKYHFSTRECGQLTGLHLYNDRYIQGISFKHPHLEKELHDLHQAAYEREQKIMELNGQVHERQYTIEKNKLEIQALKDQDQMAQAHIGRLNGLLAEKEQQMEQAASQNRETVAALEQRIAALRQAGSDQEAVIAQLQQSLSEVTGSTSWKATAPLRRIGKLFRKSDQTRKS